MVLNLVPVLNEALKGVQAEASGLFGKNLTLPAITSSSIPAADCQKIAAAIGHPLPPTCGQIALFPASSLTGAQYAYHAFNGIALLLLILTPLAFIAALWVSPHRRRTLLQLTIGGMLALIVVRRAMCWLESDLIAGAKPQNPGGAERDRGPGSARGPRRHLVVLDRRPHRSGRGAAGRALAPVAKTAVVAAAVTRRVGHRRI